VTISQITFAKKAPVENGWLMVGDAAGMITPLCGNGMSMAMNAAALAFPLIVQFLDQKISRQQMETTYAQQWNRQFGRRVAVGRMLQPLMLNPQWSNGAVSLLAHAPFLVRQIVSLTHGQPF
jgi:flavin-dependent dehydrogenase